jgi:hypothetical protein
MDDDELMMLLSESLATDRVMSPRARDAALGAREWVRIEGEFAEVAFDTADEPELAGLRGGAGERLVTYQGGGLTLECRYGPGGLVAELLPAGAARVWLRSPGTERELEVDEHGRFAEAGLPGGPLSLKVQRGGVPDLVTPWLLL